MDAYKILGVSRKADPVEVKKAYRTLSKMYHPDNIKTGDPVKFKEVKEAYELIESGEADIYVEPVHITLKHETLFKFKVA